VLRKNICLPDRPYRHVFLVQNRDYWQACPYNYDAKVDLVLTFDFALVRQITLQGGTAAFLDHLVDNAIMERYNFETYDFFAKWYLDRDGHDLFAYQGVAVGNAFRLHLWNDLTYLARMALNLLAVRRLTYDRVLVGLSDTMTADLLPTLGLKSEAWCATGAPKAPEYAFPIFRWMDERVGSVSLKQRLKALVKDGASWVQRWGDRLKLLSNLPLDVFVQSYYPTHRLIRRLKQDGRVNVILDTVTWGKDLTRERRLAVGKPGRRHRRLAEEMVDRFQGEKASHWQVEDLDLSGCLYPIFLERIARHLPEYLKTLEDVAAYFAERQLRLMVPVTETWTINCLLMNYCQARGIPTYLIINGYLGAAYLDEAKHATWVNAYGESIQHHYFRGMSNVVCLGDPRMDDYVNRPPVKRARTDRPTIMIGTAGFNNIDLNSYVAYEFDFLNDLMAACRTLQARGRKMDLVLKVRTNGYLSQYGAFLAEYYPDLAVQLIDRVPFSQVVQRADFYISFYSQTLFEASCLGIPVLYFKKDTEISDPPFDGNSELVTACSFEDLVNKMELFYQRDPIYLPFQDKAVMEKYLGPLDGHNLERNLEFIYSLAFDGRPPKGSQA
jgi:hypothetical protein